MKITFFRLLSILILTLSCSATRVSAQYSVCCPASDADAFIPENQCNDYLEAAANQPSAENWIDRVSKVLQYDETHLQKDVPVQTAPDAATPIDFDCFSRGPCGGISTNEAVSKKSTKQSVNNSNKQQSTNLIILREDNPGQAATLELAVGTQTLVERLTKNFLTWSALDHVQQPPAQEFSYWDAVKDLDYSANVLQARTSSGISYWDAVMNLDYSKNVLQARTSSGISYWDAVMNLDYSKNVLQARTSSKISYWDAVKNLDYSTNVSEARTSSGISYWDAVKNLDYSKNALHARTSSEISYWDAVKNLDYSANTSQSTSQSVNTSELELDNRVNHSEPDYSQYDLYDVEAGYLYGCFGYESIYGCYGLNSSENSAAAAATQPALSANYATDDSVNEIIESSAENQSATAPQSSAVPFGAEFDGYRPYDVDERQIDREESLEADSIEVIEKRAPLGLNGQDIDFVIGCPFEQKSSKLVGELPFSLEELTLLPRLLERFVGHIFRVFYRWDVVQSAWQVNSRIEMALCGSESLTVWRDAIWAHHMSREVTRELEIAQSRREKMLSIAQTLDLIGDHLKQASANLVFLAERESHKLIGRRASASISR